MSLRLLILSDPFLVTNAVVSLLLPMSLLTVSVLSAAIALSWAVEIRLVAALFMSVPAFGVLWIFAQNTRAGLARAYALTQRRVNRKILPELVTLRSEVAILSAAGFIAALLPHQIDTDQLGQLLVGLGLNEGWLLVGLLWFVALTSPIGLNPIVSVTVSIEMLSRLQGFSFDPYVLALGGIWAWSLATGLSPLGATIRISGRTINRSPAVVGLVWNRQFSLIFLLIASAALLVLN